MRMSTLRITSITNLEESQVRVQHARAILQKERRQVCSQCLRWVDVKSEIRNKFRGVMVNFSNLFLIGRAAVIVIKCSN